MLLPPLGYGLGLRAHYYQTILDTLPSVDWFEAMSEDYMIPGGRPLYFLEKVREHYPIVIHGVSLSIGSADPLDMSYLKKLKQLADRIQPAWVSDHLCWTGVKGFNMHDLLPLPYTEEAIKHVVEKVKKVQDFLGRQILLENVSSYVTFTESQISEWEFVTAVAEQADCLLLLDVNNIYVSAFNHHFDPIAYLDGVPRERIQKFHLAGHEKHEEYIVDTHDEPIIDGVWELYKEALKRFGTVSTLIERDGNFPPFPELLAEVEEARGIGDSIVGKYPILKENKKLVEEY
jgi:uncharacterized protein